MKSASYIDGAPKTSGKALAAERLAAKAQWAAEFYAGAKIAPPSRPVRRLIARLNLEAETRRAAARVGKIKRRATTSEPKKASPKVDKDLSRQMLAARVAVEREHQHPSHTHPRRKRNASPKRIAEHQGRIDQALATVIAEHQAEAA